MILITYESFLELARSLCPNYDRQAIKIVYYQWQKTTGEKTEETAVLFLRSSLPSPNEFKLSACLDGYPVHERSLYKAEKWCRAHKCSIHNTLEGPFVEAEVVDRLTQFLETSNPIYPAFLSFLDGAIISYSPSTYADCLRTIKRNPAVIREINHPIYDSTDFFLGSNDALFGLFKQWAEEYTINNPAKKRGFLSIGDAAKKLNAGPDNVLSWARRNPQSTQYCFGQLLVRSNVVDSLVDMWERAVVLDRLVEQQINEFPVKIKSRAKTLIIDAFKAEKNPNVVEGCYFPQANNAEALYILSNLDSIEESIARLANQVQLFPLNKVKEITKLSPEDLLKKIALGIIHARREEGQYYISLNERNRIRFLAEEYISLDEVIRGVLAQNPNSIFNINKGADHEQLRQWLEDAGLVKYLTPSRELPLREEKSGYHLALNNVVILSDKLTIWCECFRLPPKQAAEKLLARFCKPFPKTVEQLSIFRSSKEAAGEINDNAFLDVIDMIFSSIDCEIEIMSEEEIETKIVEPNKNRTLVSCNMLSEFLLHAGLTNRKYSFCGTGFSPRKEAYSILQANIITAACCNVEIWEETNLIQKAVGNSRYADMWLYFTLHVYAPWRSTDFIRLDPPKLVYSPQDTLRRIALNDYSSEASNYVANYFLTTIELSQAQPHKTSNYPNVPDLSFMCPESCHEPFGIILSIAAAHYYLAPEDKPFVTAVTDIQTIKAFFGNDVAAACEYRTFSGKRLTKALLQGVVNEAVEGERYNPTVAYYMASIMRAHKGGYSKIPETTRYYLEDANFAGMTPEHVAYMMFERGACSLLLWQVLEAAYGEKFQSLSENHKTRVIQSMPTPYQTERAVAMKNKAENDVAKIMADFQFDEGYPAKTISRIISGLANSKDCSRAICLLKAIEKPCRFPLRMGCLGCNYEILTKQMLIHLFRERNRLLNSSAQDAAKNQWLIANVVYPAVSEIVSEMSRWLPDEIINQYLTICEEVLNEYGVASEETM